MRINCIEALAMPNCDRKAVLLRRCILALGGLAAVAGVLNTVGCSSDKGDTEPTVTVQVAAVEKTTIQHTISTQAILFPRQQAAIVPKIRGEVWASEVFAKWQADDEVSQMVKNAITRKTENK